MRYRFAAIVVLLLAACATRSADKVAAISALLPADVILLGEQHDAPEHQVMHREAIDMLAARGELAAVALEMAEQGQSTAGLGRDASEEAVKTALKWNEDAWPWQPYAPAVLAAVRAGVTVVGANLPRGLMRASMSDARLDEAVTAAVLNAQREAVAKGHCGALPASQIAPMTRVQIARDQAMARTLAQAASPGKTVVLIAGSGHVDPQVGVSQHLPAGLRSRSLAWPAASPKKDYCAEFLRSRQPGL